MSSDDDFYTVRVSFDSKPESKLYTYRVPRSMTLEPGDNVVVEVGVGRKLQVVYVRINDGPFVQLPEWASSWKDIGWVICKVPKERRPL